MDYIARQAPLSLGFSRQEYWSGVSSPPPGDLLDPGIKPTSLYISCIGRWGFLNHWHHMGIPKSNYTPTKMTLKRKKMGPTPSSRYPHETKDREMDLIQTWRWRQRWSDAVTKPRFPWIQQKLGHSGTILAQKLWGQRSPADTLILDFWTPKPWENTFLLF